MILSSSNQFSGRPERPRNSESSWFASIPGFRKRDTSNLTAGRESPPPNTSARSSVDKFEIIGDKAEDHGIQAMPAGLESPKLKAKKSEDFVLVGTKPEDYGMEALENSTGSLSASKNQEGRKSVTKKVDFDEETKSKLDAAAPEFKPGIAYTHSPTVEIVSERPPRSTPTPPPPGFRLDETRHLEPRNQYEQPQTRKIYLPHGNKRDDAGVKNWIEIEEKRGREVISTVEKRIETVATHWSPT